jgi:hypothetical protein
MQHLFFLSCSYSSAYFLQNDYRPRSGYGTLSIARSVVRDRDNDEGSHRPSVQSMSCFDIAQDFLRRA